MGCGAYGYVTHGQQSGQFLQGPRQDGAGEVDVYAGTERVRDDTWC